MDIQDLIKFCLQASVIINVYALGMETTRQDVVYVLGRPALLLRAVLAIFVIMPVLAIVLVKLFGMTHALQVTLLCLAISPVPPLLPKRQDKGGGHSGFALGLMVCMALLALVLIPLWLGQMGRIFGQSTRLDIGAIAWTVMKMIVLPLLVGMAVRAWLPVLAGRVTRPAIVLAGWLLPLAGLVVVYAMHQALWQLLVGGAWMALAIFTLLGLAAGHLLGGPDIDQRVVLGVSTASRHPGIAFALAAANAPQDHAVPALIGLYVLLSFILTLLYMKWQARRVARNV